MATVIAEITYIGYGGSPLILGSPTTGAISIACDPEFKCVISLQHVPSDMQLAYFFIKSQTKAHGMHCQCTYS